MSSIVWNDKVHSVNIEKIDEQHKKLVGFLNELREACDQDKSQGVTESIIDRLKAYTKYHFALEEQLMQAYGFPGLDEHKKTHNYFIEFIVELEIDYISGKKDVSARTLNLLEDWVEKHIKIIDKEYTEHMNNNGVF